MRTFPTQKRGENNLEFTSELVLFFKGIYFLPIPVITRFTFLNHSDGHDKNSRSWMQLLILFGYSNPDVHFGIIFFNEHSGALASGKSRNEAAICGFSRLQSTEIDDFFFCTITKYFTRV